MMALKKPVSRITPEHQWERGRDRAIVVSIEPPVEGVAPSMLGFRLAGTRRTFRLPVRTCWLLAMAEERAAGRAKARR